MTLTVPLEEFAEAVTRVLGHKDAYISPRGGGSLITAAADGKVVLTSSKLLPDVVEAQLTSAGLKIHRGTWRVSDDSDATDMENIYVAAVSYVSSDEKPGLWMDAYPDPPTAIQVLKALYDEFASTGEVQDASFEDFLRLSNANVVILGPADLRSFAHQKLEC